MGSQIGVLARKIRLAMTEGWWNHELNTIT